MQKFAKLENKKRYKVTKFMLKRVFDYKKLKT